MTPNGSCFFCPEPSTKLCDYMIAVSTTCADPSGRLLADLDSGFISCDAEVCATHAHRVGFFSGAKPDTIDYCEYHKTAKFDIANHLTRPKELSAKIREERAHLFRLAMRMNN